MADVENGTEAPGAHTASFTDVSIYLSDYEKKRLENIKRNNARLRALGLISALEEKRSNDTAAGIHTVEDAKSIQDDNDEDASSDEKWDRHGDGSEKKRTGKRKRKEVKKASIVGSRKSLRLQGVEAELKPDGDLPLVPHVSSDRNAILTERLERVKECREVRLKAAKAVASAGAEAAAKENPTATYEHCLMRVRSMSEKRLATRVKVIEKAAGKHCVVKMAIFKSCLQDEGMWSLAELASEALERLKALKPIPA